MRPREHLVPAKIIDGADVVAMCTGPIMIELSEGGQKTLTHPQNLRQRSDAGLGAGIQHAIDVRKNRTFCPRYRIDCHASEAGQGRKRLDRRWQLKASSDRHRWHTLYP